MSKHPRTPTHDDPPVEGKHAHDDELIVVPKGGSKTKFLLTFLLVIMLLGMFTVSDEVVRVLTGESRSGEYMSWTHPTKGKQTISGPDFVLEKRLLTHIFNILSGGQRREQTDDDTAFFIVLSAVAEDAGVHITDKELQDTIKNIFGTSQRYDEVLRRYQLSPKQMEGGLRRILCAERYQRLIMAPLFTPEPSELERTWKARHQEYAFDYVELAVESMKPEAAALAPGTEELKAWFEALPEAKRKAFETKRAVSAEIAVFPFASETEPSALLAKYPLPAEQTIDKAAQDYYDGFSYVRFRNPNFEFKPGTVPTEADLFLPFEAAKAQATREAPIYQAMIDWQSDLAARLEKGEAASLLDEAQAFGIPYHIESKPLTQAEWEKIDQPWMGKYVADTLIMNSQPGKYLPSVTVFDKGLAVGRVMEVVPTRMPAFEEIESQVRDEWIKKRAGELAVEKLEGLRDKLGTRPGPDDAGAPAFMPECDEETFKKVAGDAGFTVARRDYLERNAQIAPENVTPASTFLRQTSSLYTSKESSVGKAELASDGQHAYLVRVVGLRDAPIVKMTPEETKQLSEELARVALVGFENRTFQSREFMQSRYGLHLAAWDRDTAGQTTAQ